MRPPRYSADSLRDLLHRQTVATLPELMAALGTDSQRTTVRKLRDLPHFTSYSHNGRFYVLADRPEFDAHGLWSFHDVRFSVRGNLLLTIAQLVADSAAGYRVEELDALLLVRTGDALRKLAARGQVSREQRHGRFWYAAADPAERDRQRTARQAAEQLEALPAGKAPARGDLGAALQTFLGTLDERQRRWFAGLESLRRGHGGDRRAAALLGLDAATVARGRAADASHSKKKPGIVERLKRMLHNDTAGDPVRGHRWCRRSTANLALALAADGFPACPRSVARLLRSLRFCLRVNRKSIAPATHPRRDE